jgi:glycosyltransferase involved in cell wall biosynthesis
MQLNRLKIAIVCDWLTNMGGAEKVILAIHNLFPRAPIYTTVYNKDLLPEFKDAKIITSYLQHMPLAKRKHQLYLGFMPRIFENLNLDEYDIVISSSHSCAKGIITKPSTLHVCYCHTPMRYAWEDSINYIKEYEINPIIKRMAPHFIHKIRIWDRLSADRVDNFIANSAYVQQRIYKYYRKPSSVIHPFTDISQFEVGHQRRDYYLAVGRLTPYKKFDLLVDTFNETGLPLKIVGSGVEIKKLKAKAKPNIEFLGNVSDMVRNELYKKAKAFLFPQVEDFGITPLEAMACGCPVIAYAKGGAMETVIDKKTGILFKEQNPESIKKAIRRFTLTKFNHNKIREHAEQFDIEVFNNKFLEFLEKKYTKWKKDMYI